MNSRNGDIVCITSRSLATRRNLKKSSKQDSSPVIIPSKQSDKVTKTILGLRKEKEIEIM